MVIVFWSLLFLSFINLACFAESVAPRLNNETDRLALLAFRDQITPDPNGILSSWNDTLHFCMWGGVACSKRHPQRVTELNLKNNYLAGYLSPHIGNLSFLRTIDLLNNSFRGRIPHEIAHLHRLQILDLDTNSFNGEFPKFLIHCLQLEFLSLDNNKLDGKIPREMGSLSKLYQLSLSNNNLTGRIPPSLGNLSSLTYLDLTDNSLDGSIPQEIGQLVNVEYLFLEDNKHSGEIPSSLYNLSLIRGLSVGGNRLRGSLPPDLGIMLPKLEELHVGENRFAGSIPVSLGNASRLVILDFISNNFSGFMPMNLGRLEGLRWLSVRDNQLFNEKDDEEFSFITSLSNCSGLEHLDLSYNQFGGKLPNSIANLSTHLTMILLERNQIFGAIPTGIENLSNLILLDIRDNLLKGSIPINLMKLKSLQELLMGGNKLSGKIPISIGNLTRLYKLDLSRNDLHGSIPESLRNCRYLQRVFLNDNNLNGTMPKQVADIPTLLEFDVNMNNLTGSLPLDIGKLKNLFRLNISNNRLSGEIPSTLSTCHSLEYLYMGRNQLTGSIPPSLSELRGLRELDLSSNNLRGDIPRKLAQLHFLVYLNLSFNNLEGEVPKDGIFQNASAFSILGNGKLCGGIPKLKLPICSKQGVKKQERPLSRRVIISIVVAVVLFSILSLYFLVVRSKKLRKKLSSTSSMKDRFLRVTYGDLFKATNGFSSNNLIGVGNYSCVYMGIIDHMEPPTVAIKVLKLQQRRASKSFTAECQALGSIKHRNIVKISTVCSGIDFSGNDFKALVLEYMRNGSLDSWLHPSVNELHQSKTLSLVQRLNVAIDIACALDYLHHHCQVPIIHCDLKPSNVLLDGDMVAHVGDFGLARILSKDINYSQTHTNSLAIKGSIEYVAPEYGMGADTSKYGDVYSYGILLLEMLTGKRPSDDMFTNNLSLHQFAKMVVPERVMEIIDYQLLAEEIEIIRHNENYNEVRSVMYECLVSLVKMGVSCSVELPKERMEMKDVVTELQKVRDFYLGAQK